MRRVGLLEYHRTMRTTAIAALLILAGCGGGGADARHWDRATDFPGYIERADDPADDLYHPFLTYYRTLGPDGRINDQWIVFQTGQFVEDDDEVHRILDEHHPFDNHWFPGPVNPVGWWWDYVKGERYYVD